MASVKVPTVKNVKSMGTKSIVAGAAGGIGVSLGTAILGPALGPAAGGILAGAAIGGDQGEIVAINATMDCMVTLFMGGSDNNSGGVM